MAQSNIVKSLFWS